MYKETILLPLVPIANIFILVEINPVKTYIKVRLANIVFNNYESYCLSLSVLKVDGVLCSKEVTRAEFLPDDLQRMRLYYQLYRQNGCTWSLAGCCLCVHYHKLPTRLVTTKFPMLKTVHRLLFQWAMWPFPKKSRNNVNHILLQNWGHPNGKNISDFRNLKQSIGVSWEVKLGISVYPCRLKGIGANLQWLQLQITFAKYK